MVGAACPELGKLKIGEFDLFPGFREKAEKGMFSVDLQKLAPCRSQSQVQLEHGAPAAQSSVRVAIGNRSMPESLLQTPCRLGYG